MHEQRINKGHGRIETRTCTTIADPALLTPLRRSEAWTGLRSLIEIRAERQVDGEHTTKVRYYLSSLDGDPAEALRVTRTHWNNHSLTLCAPYGRMSAAIFLLIFVR